MNIAKCFELHTPDESYKFTGSVHRNKPLPMKIRSVNRATGMETWQHWKVGKETSNVPEGIGLFQYTGDEHYLRAADREIQHLFENRRLFSDMTPQENKADVIALFWATAEKDVISLKAGLERLRQKGLTSVPNIMTAYYVPLMMKLLELSKEDVMNASFELIRYGDSNKAGLEQHVDNVTRTKGIMGPICSINFVSSRSIDMLPSMQEEGIPLRICTAPGDLLILDSEARIHWSHSVPYGRTNAKRYSAVIRPVTTGVCFGVLKQQSKFGPPIHKAPPSLRGIQPFTIPELLCTKEESQYITWPSDALRRNAHLVHLNPVHIWDIFAGIGGDTVQFLTLLANSHIHAVQIPTDDGRLERLKANTAQFAERCSVHAYSAAQFLESKKGSSCDLLYLDPPWMENEVFLSPSRLRETLEANVFRPTESTSIKTMCLKTKFPWHVLHLPFKLARSIPAGDADQKPKYFFHFFNKKQETTPAVLTLKIKFSNASLLKTVMQTAPTNKAPLEMLQHIINHMKSKQGNLLNGAGQRCSNHPACTLAHEEAQTSAHEEQCSSHPACTPAHEETPSCAHEEEAPPCYDTQQSC